MNIKTSYDIMRGTNLLARCCCLSEAVSECRKRGYLCTEGVDIHKVYHDNTITRLLTVYNVYGEEYSASLVRIMREVIA